MPPSPIQHLARALGTDAAVRVLDEVHAQHEDLGLDTAIMARDRMQLTKRLDHRDLKTTHVVVGDHTAEPKASGPERRAVHSYRDKITGLMCHTDADGYQRVDPSP
jgi:hypothetical protein